MPIGEDIFDTGDDFQKAKRSCFLTSFLGLILSTANLSADTSQKLKIFDVELNVQYWIFLSVSMFAMMYCAINFFIQERREFVRHSSLVMTYQDISLKNALANIKARLDRIDDIGEKIASTASPSRELPAGIAYDRIPDDWDMVNLSEAYQQALRTAQHPVGRFPIEEDPIEAARFQKLTIEYRQQISNHLASAYGKLKEAATVDLRNGPNMLIQHWSSEVQNRLNELSNIISKNIPDLKNELNSISRDISRISDSIAPRESFFFHFDRLVVYTVLVLSFSLCGNRLYQESPNLQLSWIHSSQPSLSLRRSESQVPHSGQDRRDVRS